MVTVPLIVVWVTSQVLYFKLPTVAALLLSIALSWICAVVAARIWERRSKTAEISFSELMIWSWYRLQKAERRIERGLRAAATSETHEEQLTVLHDLADALESKDPYTRGHSRRVERHSFKTGIAMCLPPEDVEVLRMSASLHDVGKIRIPNTVLHKEGPLTDEERALVQQHPVVGASIVAILHDDEVVEAVRHHHERWHGGGYPDGIAGTEIPLFSRVIAVADSYDAIRSNRSYRRGASRDQAVKVLTEESGRQLDAEVVEAFLTTLPARGRAVAAMTSLATGPGALWRYLGQLFQRFGSTALAPALGVAGTAVILGASSLLTPGIPVVSAMENGPGLTDSPSASTAPADGSQKQARQRVAAQERAERRTARRREREAAQRAERRAQQRAERRAARQRDRATVAGSTNNGSGSATTAVVAQQPPTTSGPSATSGGNQGTNGDPNDQGKDCEQGSRARSKGYRKHCG